MTFSVWNNSTRAYDYYETPRSQPITMPVPHHLGHKTLGVTPVQAAWPLPKAAVRRGAGPYPKGVIAAPAAAALGEALEGTRNWIIIGGLAVAAYLLWKQTKRA